MNHKEKNSDRIKIITQSGSSPVCPKCGHWNAMLDKIIYKKDGYVKLFKCRDCGFEIAANKVIIEIQEADAFCMGNQTTYHTIESIFGENY